MAPAENNSFVKLSRNILDWEWYTEPCTRALFIHCILKANWKDGSWQGQPCKRGQFITSLQKLSSETSYSVQNIKTGLKHLISTGELTSQSTNKYRIITVCNYDKYQVTDTQTDNQETSNRQSNDILTTTIEEGKKGRIIITIVCFLNVFGKNIHVKKKNLLLTKLITPALRKDIPKTIY